MSDTGDSTTKIGIDASVTGTGEVAGLSSQVASLSQHLSNLSASALKSFNTQDSLNKALEQTRKSTSIISGSLNEYRKNLEITRKTIDETTKRLDALTAAQTRAASAGKLTPETLAGYEQTRKHLNGMAGSVSGLTKVMRGNAIDQFGAKMKAAGQTAQRSAYYMTAATMPMLLAFKSAFFNFTKLEQEQVRLRKLIGDNFEGMADGSKRLADEFAKIDRGLDAITRKFGTSRVLVQSLAGDFAEIGVPADAVIRLTEFTAAAEKLGNLDISASQNFIQSLYQNVVRVRREVAQKSGLNFDISSAKEMNQILDEVQGQLALFNLIENKTSLSLKDIADAFPEVSAAATTFGLSMTETAALLTPMVAAGFQVGASANSIKVSLQRLVAMTKQNTTIIQELNQSIGEDFNMAADVGMRSIQRLVDGYAQLKESKGEQGALEFFSRLFGVRQGPRMEVAIQQMAAFQEALQKTGSAESVIAKRLQDAVNLRLRQSGMEEISINKVIDLTNLHRSAIEESNGEYTERAKVIQGAQKEAADMLKKEFAGTSDYLAKVGTETGREIFMQSIGGVTAANATMQAELAQAIATTAANFNRLRESFLAIGRQFVPVVGSIIEKILPIIQKIEEFVTNLGPMTKKIIGGFLIFLIIVPQIKMLAAVFKMLFGSTISFFGRAVGGSNSLFKSLSGVAAKMIDIEDMVNNPKLLKGFNKLTQFGDKILLEQSPTSAGYGKGLLGRRRMLPTEATTAISQPLKELLANKGLVGPTDAKSAKGILSKVSKTGLTDTTSLIKSMLGITDEAKKSTKASAKAADKAAKAIDKTTTATADKLTKGIKGSVFQNNTFLGNRFGGNTAGPGGSGSGPRTPKTPKTSGTPTVPVKSPSFVAPGVSKGVTFADLPKSKLTPAGSAGAAVASIFAGITSAISGALGAPADGSTTPKPKVRKPVAMKPSFDLKTVLAEMAAGITGTSSLPAGAASKATETVKTAVEKTKETIKDLSAVSGEVGRGAETILKTVDDTGVTGSRAPPRAKGAAKRVAKAVTAATVAVENAVVGVSEVVTDGLNVSNNNLENAAKTAANIKPPKVPKAAKEVVKGLSSVQAHSIVKLHFKELANVYKKAGILIPENYRFLETVDKEFEMTKRSKAQFLRLMRKQIESGPEGAANPFGEYQKTTKGRSTFKPFTRSGSDLRDIFSASQSPRLPLFTDILAYEADATRGSDSGVQKAEKRKVLERAKRVLTKKPIKAGSVRDVKKVQSAARAAQLDFLREYNSKLPYADTAFNQAPPPLGVEEVYRPGDEDYRKNIKKALEENRKKLDQVKRKLQTARSVQVKKELNDAQGYLELERRRLISNLYGPMKDPVLMPASITDRAMLNTQRDAAAGSLLGLDRLKNVDDQNNPLKSQQYSKDLINLIKSSPIDGPDGATRALYELALEDQISQVGKATDKATIDAINKKSKIISQQLRTNKKTASSAAIKAAAIRSVAQDRVNLDQFNPMSESYDSKAQQRLLSKKGLVSAVKQKFKGQAGFDVLSKNLDAMQKDVSATAYKGREKILSQYKKLLASLTKAVPVLPSVAPVASSTVSPAMQAAMNLIPKATTGTSVIPGGLPSMDPYATESGSRPGLKMPKVFRQGLAFVNKGGGAAGAIAGIAATVQGLTKTYGDLVNETIEKIISQLPSSLGQVKPLLLREITKALVQVQPLGAGVVSGQALTLLKQPLSSDPAIVSEITKNLNDTVVKVVDDYKRALSEGVLYSTTDYDKKLTSGRPSKLFKEKAKKALSRALMVPKGGTFTSVFNKFLKDSKQLGIVLSGIVIDQIAAASRGIELLEAEGKIGAGTDLAKARSLVGGKKGIVEKLKNIRLGKEKPEVPLDDSRRALEESSTTPRSRGRSKAIEKPVETTAADSLTKSKEEAVDAIDKGTAATKTGTAAAETKTAADTKAAATTKEATVAETTATASTKAKTVKTLESLTAASYDAKITEMLGASKVKQLATIDAQIASMTAEQISSEAGQAVIAQRNEVTKKLVSLEKAQAELVAAQKNAEDIGRKNTTRLTQAKRDLAKKLENAKTETDKLARKTKSLTDSMKPAKVKPAVTPADAAVVPVDTTAGKAPRGARSPKTIVPPKVGGAATAAATAAASGTSGIIKKLDEVAISFDKSLANFFKGPNFFQGPNIFQGKIISADKLKITMTDRARDASRLAKARASLIPSDDPLVERARRRSALAAVRKSILDKPGAVIDSERAAKLRRIVGIDPRKTTAVPAMSTPATVTSSVSTTVKATKTAMGKITDLIKLGISKGFHAGSKLGMTAVTKFVALYSLAFKSASKAGVDAMSQIILTMGLLFGKTVAAKSATGALASSYKFLSGVSTKLGESLKKNLVETIFLMRMLGNAIRQDVGAALVQLMTSLANSKVIKIWSFLLFTGMNKFYKILRTTLISMSLFSSHGARMAAVTKSLEAVSKMRVAAGLSATIPMIQELIIRITSYLGLVRGLRGAFQALTKTMASALALGIKINASLMLIAPIFLLISGLIMTFRTGLSNSAPALKNFKEAWVLIKEAIVKLSQPFMALINKFGNIGKAASGADEASGALYNISRAVKYVATAFNNFARSTGLRFINNSMIPVLTRVINRFILLGRAIKGAFKNDGTAVSNFKGFLLSLAYEVVSIGQKIFAGLAVVSAALGPVLVKLIEAVANATIDAFMYIINFGKEVALFVGSIVTGLGLALSATAIGSGVGLQIAGIGAGLIAASGAATLLEKNIGKVRKKVGEASTAIGIGMAQGMARGARYMEKEFLGGIKASIAKKYGEEIGADVNAALTKQVGDPKDIKDALDEALEGSVKNPTSANAAGESLAKNIAKGIKDKLISLKEDFTSSFFSKADDQISKIVDKYKEAVDVQKEEALKALDTQIAAIEALADAEEELTAKMEYEQKRREMILAKSLDRENYLRERTIAKYEGRTEDVRSLDLSFRKSDKESTKDIEDLDTDRAKTLQEKQRSIAIAVINREKEAMGKTFDEMQKQFDINIDKILNKGFSTKEEFSALLTEIAGAGASFSSEINDVFTNTMNGLPSAIRTVTDPSIGMFSMTMAALVDQAKKSFGAEVGTANAESILGAAYFMAKGMPDAFKTAFSDGVISQSVTPFVAKVTSIIGNVNVDSIWIEAGRSAIEAMINEMKRKLLGLKGTLYDQFKELFAGMSADYNKLFPELERLAKEIARIEAIRSNSDSGAGADPEKPKPSAGSSTDKYPIDPKSGEHLARRPLAGITASMGAGEKESSFFGSMIDGAKKLAEALGPVKTAILGAVGAIAGFFALKGLFSVIAASFKFIAGAVAAAAGTVSAVALSIAAVIGIIVGIFIYMYLKFESFRKMVNDTFKKFFNFIKDGFEALKQPVVDLTFAIFDGVKSIIVSVFGPIIKAIGGIIAGVIWAFMGALAVVATVLDKIKKPVFGVIAFIINLATSVVKIITAIITTTFDTFYGAIGGTVKIIGAVFVVLFNIFKSVFGAILDFAKGPFDWLSINGPKILDPISKVFGNIKDVVSNVFNTIKDIVSNVFNAISEKFDFIKIKFTSVSDILLAPFGLLFKVVKDNFGKISNFIGDVFEKINFDRVLDIITTPFKLVFDVIKKTFEPVVGLFLTIGSFIISLLVAPFKALFDVFKAIASNPIVGFFARVIAGVTIFAAIVATWTVKVVFETIISVVVNLYNRIKNLAEIVIGIVGPAFSWFKDLVVGVWNTITDKINQFIDWFNKEFGSLWNLLLLPFAAVGAALEWLYEYMKKNLGPVIKNLWQNFKDGIDVVWSKITNFANWVSDVFGGVWGKIKEIVSKLWSGINTAVDIAYNALKNFGSWLKDVFGKIWNGIGPLINNIWDKLIEAVNFAWETLKKLGSWISGVFGGIWNNIGPWLGERWENFKRNIDIAWETLKKVGSWVAGVFTKVWENVGPWLGEKWENFKRNIDIIWEALKKVGSWISDVFGKVWDNVGPWLGEKWENFKRNIDIIWEALKALGSWLGDVFGAIWDKIGPWLGEKWENFKRNIDIVWEVLKKVGSWLGDVFSKIWDKIGPWLGERWENLKRNVDIVWEVLKKVGSWLVDVFKKAWDKINDAVDYLIIIWDKFVELFKKTKDKVVEIITAIGDKIGSAIGWAIGKLSGAWDSFADKMGEIWIKVKEIATNIGDWLSSAIGGAIDGIKTAIGLIPEVLKGAVNVVIRSWNNIWKLMDKAKFPKTMFGLPLPGFIAGKSISDFISLPLIKELYNGGPVGSYMNGGKVGSYMSGGMTYMKGGMTYGSGGMTYGPAQQGIPAILHGGEYVINHKAVQRIGTDVLDRMNSLRLSKPNLPTMPSIPSINMPNMRINNSAGTGGENYSTQNVNIYVDNFIGEPEWFNSMMKKYNTTVLPRNKKAAGLESRVVNSYNGINRGL